MAKYYGSSGEIWFFAICLLSQSATLEETMYKAVEGPSTRFIVFENWMDGVLLFLNQTR